MLDKISVVDKIEIVGEYKHVQVRTAMQIVENGNVISSDYHRHMISPGQDYSNETKEVQSICALVHTPEIIEAYENSLSNQVY